MGSESGTYESLRSGTEEELQYRLSLLGPGDVVRGIFLNSVLEVVRQLGDEASVQRCLEESGETRFLEFFNYPFSTWLRMIYTAARMLSDKHGGFDVAIREMGYRAAKDFYQSSAGKVLLLLAHNEPLRLLNNMPSTTQAILGDNTGLGQTTRTGRTSSVLSYTRDLVPRAYNEGALKAALEAVNAKEVQVLARAKGPLETDYELSWK
jgi:uncharacterized protein (TIGR02265 family)